MLTQSTHTIPASPDAVAAAMDRDSFLLARARHDPAHVSATVLRPGPLEVRVESTMHARSRTGAIDRTRQETSTLIYRWGPDRRTIRWVWSGNTVVPIEVEGTWTLAPALVGTRLRSEVRVTVRAPLVGRLVEGIVNRHLEAAEAALGTDVAGHLV